MKVFKDLYNYRELLKTSVKKDIGGKYKHSFLGVLWSFINPLLQILVYALIFPLVMKNGGSYKDYTVFMVCGLIPWAYFTTVINRASFIMIENGNILKKVYFPRSILPLSLVTSETINPLVLLIQYVLLLGIALIFSAITVYMRDIQHFIGVVLQLLFYATPIVYSIDTIPEGFRWILKWNPMTYIIEGYRAIFYNQTMPDLKALGILGVISIVILIVGYLLFNKLQKRFAEEL